ncbi:hypothetical protein RvY_10407-2 [Ramazzottius varieornatus]|uniref:Uncharacterized protein n=1 Tax=Ramazzottius varieornatus TaxID=947166 RepID=A0A1D1VF39_RAMVA|nr:hypothetical protein RvY_10407-2 [Ramazzottius varieornatus]
MQKNLATTNYNEAFHSKVKRIVGEVADLRQVTLGMLKMAEEQKNDMVNALFDQGPFKLRPEFAALRIQESRIYDEKYVRLQIERLFFGDPGDIYLHNSKKTVVAQSHPSTKSDDTASGTDNAVL